MQEDFKYGFFNSIHNNFSNGNVTLGQIQYDPRQYFHAGDIAFVLMCSIMAFLMSVGIAMFYSGTVKTSSRKYMAFLPMMVVSLVGFEWYVWGYAAAFGNDRPSTSFGGGLALRGVLLRPMPWAPQDEWMPPACRTPPRSNECGVPTNAPFVPEIVYVFFEGMLVSIAAALVTAAAAQKDKLDHFLAFILLWVPGVYAPIARSMWGIEGWGKNLGVIDFAGGSVVHICAGSTVLAHSVFHKFMLRKLEQAISSPNSITRRHRSSRKVSATSRTVDYVQRSTSSLDIRRPDTPTGATPIVEDIDMIRYLLGMGLMWTGWFGLNAGNALGANLRAAVACVSTHLAACTGAATMAILFAIFDQSDDVDAGPDSRFQRHRWRPNQFCNGAIVGLVAISPGAGFVPHWISPVFGVIPSIIVFLLYKPIRDIFGDESSVFAYHGVSGIVGMVLTGAFAKGSVAALDGISLPDREHNGGGLDGYPKRVGFQIGGAVATAVYAFGASLLLLVLLEIIIFFCFRHERRRTKDHHIQEIHDLDILAQ